MSAEGDVRIIARISWIQLAWSLAALSLPIVLAIAAPVGAAIRITAAAIGALALAGVAPSLARALRSRKGLVWADAGQLHSVFRASAIPLGDITEVSYAPPTLRWALWVTLQWRMHAGSRPISLKTRSGAFAFPTALMAEPAAAATRLRALIGG